VRHQPAPAKSLGRDLVVSKDSPTVITSPGGTATGYFRQTFSSDPDDPLGKGTLEVIIDDKLAKTFRFKVVPDK
jgi:hypothetical protein